MNNLIYWGDKQAENVNQKNKCWHHQIKNQNITMYKNISMILGVQIQTQR